MIVARILAALVAPLLLWGCVISPGKFVSTMTINADRSFAFAYKGEFILIAPPQPKPETPGSPTDGATRPDPAPEPVDEAGVDARNRALAAAFAKEVGYRSIVYRGKGKFDVDYAISGTLTHGFSFPFNPDAQALFPFVMVELRQGGVVRVKAPAFANAQGNMLPGGSAAMMGTGIGTGMGAGQGSDAVKFLDGLFTLDTDAEIVSQNNEDGAKQDGARRSIVWRATPAARDAPMAVLKLSR